MPPRSWRSGLSGLVRLWRRQKRPLLHTNGVRGNSVAVLARLVVPGVHYVTTVHGVLSLHSRRHAAYRLVDLVAGQLAEAVIAVSADTARRIRSAGTPRTKTFVIRNGLGDWELRRLRNVAVHRSAVERPIRLGYLGRLSPEKGTRDLARVARALEEEGADVTIAIAGDGPDRTWLLRECNSLVTSGFLAYHGAVQDPAAFLSAIDVLILPSRSEGMPFVVLEAMAAGCVVVASGVGGIPEVIVDDSIGLVVEPGDVPGLLGVLLHLSEHPTEVAALGAAASRYAQDTFSLSQRLPRLCRAYGWSSGGSGSAIDPWPGEDGI